MTTKMAIDLTAMIAEEEKIDTTVDAIDEDLLLLALVHQDALTVVTIPTQIVITIVIAVVVDIDIVVVLIDLTTATTVNKIEETELT